MYQSFMKTYGDRVFAVAGPRLWNEIAYMDISNLSQYFKKIDLLFELLLVMSFRTVKRYGQLVEYALNANYYYCYY